MKLKIEELKPLKNCKETFKQLKIDGSRSAGSINKLFNSFVS